MAQMTMMLNFEMDLIGDAAADLKAVFRALAHKHGAPYRALERRIEALIDGEAEFGKPEFHRIDGSRFVVAPGGELKSILQDARALGVIR